MADAGGLTAEQKVVVTLTDVDEVPPGFTSLASATAVEGKEHIYTAEVD